MHTTSMTSMKLFMDKYVKAGDSILDVGSAIVLNQGMSYRDIIPEDTFYTGIDVADGENVDIVINDSYNWNLGKIFDVVISGQALEHIEYPWLTMAEISKNLKVGGYCCIIVPHIWLIHRFPIDTYRYNPDGLEALGKWAGLEVVDTYVGESTGLVDCVGIFKKGDRQHGI